MKVTIPKTKTAPLILFAILSVLLAMLLGLYHINKMVQYSMDAKKKDYNTVSENIITLLRHDLEDSYRVIEAAATLISKEEDLDSKRAHEVLSVLAEENSFLDMAIIDTDGNGFNIEGKELKVLSEGYYIKALEGETTASNKIYYDAEKVPYIIFATPIMDDNVVKGVLLAKADAEISDLSLTQSSLNQADRIYIINEEKELVAYVQGSDAIDFNYNEFMSKETPTKDNEVLDYIAFYQYMTVETGEETYLWEERPLGINDWNILIGRVNEVDPLTKEILRLTNAIWIFITIGIFLLFSVMIVLQRKSNRKVIKMIYLDPVTGGDNWYRFRIKASKLLNSKQFLKKKFVLVNFDINRFKIINDAYGHHKGDEVLKEIYQVIRKWVKPNEPFTRYVADQFYVLMNYQNEDEIVERLSILNDRLHQLSYTKVAKIYFGVYYITDRQDSIDRMGEFAGIAKNNVKGSNESNISFFDNSTKLRLLEEEEIEKSMNEALLNDEFHVYLQPKYTVKDESVYGAEALVRWYNSKGSMISPGYFIPIFEKNGFITELDLYMLKKVCELLRSWMDKGYKLLPVSVNISRLHFVNPNLADDIKEIVDNYDIPHNMIELELTESAFLQNKQILIQTVIMLRNYGFQVSMDDFGAGYSSLNSLKDLPLDTVKLDGELFHLTGEVERGRTVIRNTIAMAKDLHMKVVAECIETKEQVEFLYNVGCDIIQGYYYAKPMTVNQFEERYLTATDID